MPPSVEPAAAPDRSVLVIDDDKAVLQTIFFMLEGHGFKVTSAPDGRSGLRAFRQQQPDLVITDIIMPEQDGIGAIMEMRRERRDTKIIAISGGGRLGNSDFLAVARKLGADASLSKPFEQSELLGVIKSVLAGATANQPEAA